MEKLSNRCYFRIVAIFFTHSLYTTIKSSSDLQMFYYENETEILVAVQKRILLIIKRLCERVIRLDVAKSFSCNMLFKPGKQPPSNMRIDRHSYTLNDL